MTNLDVHPEVDGDIVGAAKRYLGIDPELAFSFTDEIYAMIKAARENPEHYRKFDGPYRRVLGKRFPYRVIFEIDEGNQGIYVVAVMHQSRDSDLWKERI